MLDEYIGIIYCKRFVVKSAVSINVPFIISLSGKRNWYCNGMRQLLNITFFNLSVRLWASIPISKYERVRFSSKTYLQSLEIIKAGPVKSESLTNTVLLPPFRCKESWLMKMVSLMVISCAKKLSASMRVFPLR